MLPALRKIRAAVSCHVAALPVPYRTTAARADVLSRSTDPAYDCMPGGRAFPTALDPFTCNRYEIADFGPRGATSSACATSACAAAPARTTSARLAEALGRTAAGEPVLARHVEARLLRHRRESEEEYRDDSPGGCG